MAKKSKRPAKYDLKKADRRRNLLIQIGLTAVVVVFGVALVLYIVTNKVDREAAGEAKPIRVASPQLITKDGSDEPKAVISLYEDFLCPACKNFELAFGSTINQLIDTGAVAADYYMLAILDRPQNQDYSSRSGGAAYCVADESKDGLKEEFRRFHTALFATQPSEMGTSFPSNAQLIETARQSGAAGAVTECVNGERYVEMVKGMAAATEVRATPTIRINGEDWKPTSPQDLIDKIESIVGKLPDVTAPPPPPPAPAPAPTAP